VAYVLFSFEYVICHDVTMFFRFIHQGARLDSGARVVQSCAIAATVPQCVTRVRAASSVRMGGQVALAMRTKMSV